MSQEEPRKISVKFYEKRVGPSPMKQRPMHTLMRRKPAPKIEQPMKPEPKVSSSESKTGPAKTSDANSVGSSRKPETKKQDVDKPVPKPAPVEQQRGGHYELNARMTKMVENELRHIMNKVWQELPDNPTDEAEALVVDKLRNDAGDDLKNVLGLNITKRLLNVHNPLYVKVQFSGKPVKAHLGEFLKKYNFIAFKRIEKTVNMFAAQVKSISDFDNICSNSDVRCGDVKVIVNPLYRFTKCPPNLITSFDNKDDDGSDDIMEITEKDDEAQEKADTIMPENVSKRTVVSSKPNVGPTKPETISKSELQPKVDIKTAENKSTTVNKHVAENKNHNNKPADNKPTPSNISVEKKAVITKPVQNKTGVNKAAVENKDTGNKVTVNKPATGKPAPKPTAEKTAVITKPSVEQTVVSKPAVQNKTAANKATVQNKNAANKLFEKNTELKKPQNDAKRNENIKKTAVSPVKAQAKTKTEEISHKPESDYDELDDHDILALMSEGIILDECSGSDDE